MLAITTTQAFPGPLSGTMFGDAAPSSGPSGKGVVILLTALIGAGLWVGGLLYYGRKLDEQDELETTARYHRRR
jgi:hypothetical protein